MGTIALNLSRKWRSQNFDQVVGQDLAIRILKNSLYLGHYFPVYLFAGQRGCGKTSTARIFAAALNCEQLTHFQKDPKLYAIPCLVCVSCQAMQSGSHPDFIEIDAASHTGVDNMRSIIETSSLLPIMGCKRVYLIDEAHMLSKAAFNAALKILEEPPATALFILATTNPHKIIETVRSRCFQLFFNPIAHDPLKNHLKVICDKEGIAYEDDALDIIIRHIEGSARDALNMLEQVRFSSTVVTKTSVLQLLGHMNDQQILDIVKTTLHGNAADLLQMIQSLHIDHYSAEYVWQRMMIVLRALLWIKYGQVDRFVSCSASLKTVAHQFSLAQIYYMVEQLYSYEELFNKTAMQHVLLEMVLLNICQKDKKKSDGGAGSAPANCVAAPEIINISDVERQDDQAEHDENISDDAVQWKSFVTRVIGVDHPIISSLFKQSRFLSYVAVEKKVSVEFPKELILFKEWIDTTRHIWQPLSVHYFGQEIIVEAQFTGNSKSEKNSKHSDVQAHQAIRNTTSAPTPIIIQQKKKFPVFGALHNNVIDVSDEKQWPIGAMLVRHFPGVITEIRENR